MGNVIMKAQQITYGASNVEKALDDLKAPELIELNKRMDAIDAWKADVHEVTYTGSELTIENALALPARSLKTTIEPIQDLHGYDKPWVGGAGKNKFNGVYNYHSASDYSPVLPETQYTISSKSTGERHINFHYIFSDDSYGENTLIVNIGETSGSATVTTPSNVKGIEIFVNGDATNTGNYAYDTQIELGATATSYAPYSNICPISGRSSVVLTRSDGDEISEDFTIQLGTTVYGADINWDTGVMTVTDAIFDLGNNNYAYNGGVGQFYTGELIDGAENIVGGRDGKCSIYKIEHPTDTASLSDGAITFLNRSYGVGKTIWIKDSRFTNPTDLKTALSGQTLVYPLATPTTIQLTPEQLEMLKGYNRVTIESGSIELKALVLGGDN